MYLDYFGLKENPFSLSPDPKYLFYSKNHKEALARMIYAATEDSGFMVLTGEVGTGKTLLINALINQFPKSYHFAKIYHSALNPVGLIQNICKEFKLDFADKSMTQLILNIQDFLKWNYNQGGKSLLILDEAQNLSLQTLEEIRLLSNFEAAHKKVLQIYLIGQPEFEEKLQYEHIRPLRERVSLKFKLKRLSREETNLYIMHRLKVAGIRSNLFTIEAIDEIYQVSKGVPRRINILCDNALIFGYSKLYKKINNAVIKKALSSNPMEEYAVPQYQQKVLQQSNSNSDIMVTTASRTHTEVMSNIHIVPKQNRINPSNLNKNGKNGSIDYKRIENMIYQFAKQNRNFFVAKPKPGNLISAALLAFLVFVLAIYLAILLAVEFGVLK